MPLRTARQWPWAWLQRPSSRRGSAIGRAGLPVRIPQSLDTARLLSRLAADKKKSGGKIHFVLLRKPGMPFVNGGVALECVQETIEALKA